MRIRDGKNSDPGSEVEKIRIRNKHLGSATIDGGLPDQSHSASGREYTSC